MSLESIVFNGIVVDEEKAKTSLCKCYEIDGKLICWSKGIIGALNKWQIEKYCPPEKRIVMKAPPHMPQLIFKEVAESIPKGLPLTTRLKLMRELLRKAFEELKGGEKAPSSVKPSQGEVATT